MDLINRKFGRWLVIRSAPASSHGPKWRCRCDCGIERDVFQFHLRSNKSRSCGCISAEQVATIGHANLKHGHTVGGWSKEYRSWRAMKQRCYDRGNINFENYGGRGIRVCKIWLNDFQAFLQHVGSAPSPRHSIDRWPNNNGHYEPGNVRWATGSQQRANSRPRARRVA